MAYFATPSVGPCLPRNSMEALPKIIDSSKTCTYYEICPKFEECLLSGILVSQNRKGGYPDNTASQDNNRGPYWKREGWNNFSDNTIKAAGNCPNSSDLRRQVITLTQIKEIVGHFV